MSKGRLVLDVSGKCVLEFVPSGKAQFRVEVLDDHSKCTSFINARKLLVLPTGELKYVPLELRLRVYSIQRMWEYITLIRFVFGKQGERQPRLKILYRTSRSRRYDKRFLRVYFFLRPDSLDFSGQSSRFLLQLGIAIGFLFPPMLVQNSSNVCDIEKGLRLMFYLVAAFTTIVLVLILICMYIIY